MTPLADQEWLALQAQRRALKNQQPCCIWFTGLSGAGKTTLARKLETILMARGKHTCVLDGDSLRQGLCRDLGMSAADREENIRRAAAVAALMVDAGLIVIAAFISPFQQSRAAARACFAPGEFVEVFVDTPLADCEARDVKGLYKKARQGIIKEFTGIDSPYEAPAQPDIHLHGSHCTVEESLAPVLRYLGIV